MEFISGMDLMFMQLVIVPVACIGLGVLLAVLSKKIVVGPIVSLILAVAFNSWYFTYAQPDIELTFSMVLFWAILFPIVSYFLSDLVIRHPNRQNRRYSYRHRERKI